MRTDEQANEKGSVVATKPHAHDYVDHDFDHYVDHVRVADA
jgi:hypothetical protein